jgi:hypothetical protein
MGGAELRLSTAAWWLLVLSPDESECDRLSERDRLGLTPNLTTRDLWRSRRRERGNDNFVYSSLWDFKSSFTCRKILRHGTFPLYFPYERKVCCGFLSPLKGHRLGRVLNRQPLGPVASTLTTTPPKRLTSDGRTGNSPNFPWAFVCWETRPFTYACRRPYTVFL